MSRAEQRARAVTLVGIGGDGCASLTSRAANAVLRAQILVGGERQLAFFPEFGGERLPLKKGIGAVLERVVELSGEHQVCILASGDPMFFGIGSRVIRAIGAQHVEVIPHPSSIQLAFARARLSWDDAALLSLHGRSPEGFVAKLRRVSKAAVLTDSLNSPARIAAHMLEYGESGWHVWVCENLGGPGERTRSYDVRELAAVDDHAPLNVLVLERTGMRWRAPRAVPFGPETAFAKRVPKKGLITKREVRLLSLAALELRADSVVWDIGAGSGSVSIEAAELAVDGRVYAIEIDPQGVELCAENARAHGADNVRVIAGRAPDVLAPLEAPDAVFIGGSGGNMAGIVNAALERLCPGGRLVINAVTLDNAGEAYQCLRSHELVPEVTLLQVSRAAPLASYLRYEALNPIQIFAVTKPGRPEVGS